MTKPHPFEIELITVPVTCFRCGKKAKNITIAKGSRIPRKLCSECNNVEPEGIDGEVWCRDQTRGLKFTHRIGWKTIKRGSKEWKDAAAQIRPPRKKEPGEWMEVEKFGKFVYGRGVEGSKS